MEFSSSLVVSSNLGGFIRRSMLDRSSKPLFALEWRFISRRHLRSDRDIAGCGSCCAWGCLLGDGDRCGGLCYFLGGNWSD